MMSAGEKQMTALRALLTGDFEGYKQMIRSLGTEESRDFLALVAAAFLEAVDRRFGTADLPGAVAEWVGAIRSESATAAQAIDPVTAEQVILLTLGLTQASELSGKQIRDAQLLLLPALVDEQHLDSTGIDELLAAARKLTDR
jgi:hypothetical protein